MVQRTGGVAGEGTVDSLVTAGGLLLKVPLLKTLPHSPPVHCEGDPGLVIESLSGPHMSLQISQQMSSQAGTRTPAAL